MANTSAGVPVRGICKAGHVTERVADRGRVTWQGECAHAGCDLRVHCRRIPRDATPPPPPASEAGGTTRVIRVDDYDATSSGRRDDPGGLAVADVPAADLDPSDGSEGADAGGPPADPLDEHGQRAGVVERLRRRRARRPTQWQHPLGI